MKQQFEISGGDGGAYGPVFGPVIGKEISEIHGPKNDYLLLELSEPLVAEDMTTNFMVISPRYRGDKIKKIRKKRCTVGVFRVLPGKEDDVKQEVTKDNVDYWAVGDSKPIEK